MWRHEVLTVTRVRELGSYPCKRYLLGFYMAAIMFDNNSIRYIILFLTIKRDFCSRVYLLLLFGSALHESASSVSALLHQVWLFAQQVINDTSGTSALVVFVELA